MIDHPLSAHDAVLFGLSFALCLLLVVLSRYCPRLSGRPRDLHAVQAAHTCTTPRVGGVAVFGAIVLSAVFAPMSLSSNYLLFLFPVGGLFLVGLLEDLGFNVSPRRRLLAAIVASFVVILLLGVWLPRVGIPGVDILMQSWVIGVPMTLLITAGLANGFNLIDGVNGLSSLTALTAALTMSMIAAEADYPEMVHLLLMFTMSILGFFVVNYPLGLIFLGDAGAYTIGFILSWFGISIILRSAEVSPWAILLTLFWPIADTLLAIYRRVRRRADVSKPDRLHVHQMVMRGIEIMLVGRGYRSIANPLTSVILIPFVMAPPLVGVLLWNKNLSAFLAVVGFGVVFSLSYVAAPTLIRKYRVRRSG